MPLIKMTHSIDPTAIVGCKLYPPSPARRETGSRVRMEPPGYTHTALPPYIESNYTSCSVKAKGEERQSYKCLNPVKLSHCQPSYAD